MMTSPVPQALLDAPLARGNGRGPASLQRQLHDRLKQAILGAHLAPGSRLPGTRALADALAISRNTVTAVYELLAAEGYLLPDRQGTRVATLTRPARGPAPRGAGPRAASAAPPLTARRLSPIQSEPAPTDGDAALRPGVPALAQFPLAEWRRALDRAMGGAGASTLGYGNPLGEPALRHAIARHLSVARGVRCEAAQVVVTEGAMEALTLCTRLLTNPGDTAWVEDPGYRGARTAMHAADLQIVPIRVDAEGLCVPDSDWAARPPRLIYTTPSHQYPTGAVMSAARRLELIANAQRHGAWIIEDDYDSEFRHAGEPIGAMQGLVAQAPVLYVGTFSKTMFPSLRLGFLVLPEALAVRLQAPLGQLLRGGHRHEQLALGQFIEGGAFGRHLGRMRRLYRQRQAALREALSRHLRVPHAIDGGHCGLHLTVRLPGRYPDTGIAAAALRHGMAPAALSSFALQPSADDNGLVLGYGNTPAERFEPLVKRLSQLARQTAC
jgi:GntR family transcriptional regulator/MocR family aminotransferase